MRPDAPTINDSTGIGIPSDSADFNPDAEILKLRGVKSLEELNEKYDYGVLKPGCTVGNH